MLYSICLHTPKKCPEETKHSKYEPEKQTDHTNGVALEYGSLSESADAGANYLRQLRERWVNGEPGKWAEPGADMEIDFSSIEAPSNRLAMALELAAFGFSPNLKRTIASIPKPDPREPATKVRYRIWRYEGAEPYPALPPPSATVAMHIAALAAGTYESGKSWAQASHVAEALGVVHVEDLLAVMVHPPALPPGCHALQWLLRVQQAAAEVLGQIDEGWLDSERRKALLSLLHGPGDWTTCAAINVLSRIARDEPAYALDILNCFALQEKYIPQEGSWDWPALLYEAWLINPLLTDEERKDLERKKAAWD
jgi:hypothetical protein